MKNIFKSLLVPAFALAVVPFFTSCSEDRDDNPTLRQPAGNLTLTAPAGSETTTYDLLNTESLAVTSTAPDYGFSALILYQIQVSLTEDFATSRTLGNVNQTYSNANATPEVSFECRELNDSIVSLYQAANGGANPTQDPMTAYIRVQASVSGSNTAYVYSNPVALSVIAQYVETTPDLYYLVGLNGDWNPSTNYILYPTSTTVYSYTTLVNNGSIKFWLNTDISNWKAAYGCSTDGDKSVSGTLVKSTEAAEAGAIGVPTDGEYYTFTADIENMTYTWTRLENQKPTSYSTIGLIGIGGDWNNDIAMTEVAPHNWYINTEITSDTEIKFRADNGWAASWGNGNNLNDTNYGTAEFNGGNMTISAGTYDIYFNDITTEFVFVPVE